jgi:hypothetical protein
MAETQPKLQPAFLRLSAMISQYFTRQIVRLLLSTRQRQNDMSGRNDAYDARDCRSCFSLQYGSSGDSATSHGCFAVRMSRQSRQGPMV